MTVRAAMLTLVVAAWVAPATAWAQASAPANITGAGGPLGGRGVDPKLAPPPATPLVLKPEYAAAYEARRAADAEATRRGEPPPSDATACMPYGFPRMMAVALAIRRNSTNFSRMFAPQYAARRSISIRA